MMRSQKIKAEKIMDLRQPSNRGRENTSPHAGNHFAAELYERYAAKLLAYIHKRLSSLDDAEDTLLDTFTAILQNIEALQKLPEEQLEAWIWTVARHRIADYYRRTQRRPKVSLEFLIDDIEDSASTPEQTFLQNETWQQ